MTTPVAPTVTDISDKGDGSALLAVWTGVTESNTYGAVFAPEHTPKSFQVEGTFGTSTTVLNGSLDGTNYHGLSVVSGTAISLTSAGLKAVFEQTSYYQPASSGGTGQSLNVSLLLIRPTPPRT